MAWRLAKSLETLRNQVNSQWPNRSKASDGTLGDQAHASRPSDHNPNSAGVVTAMDITHHTGYLDAHALADRLLANRHPNLKYIISNGRIGGSHTGWKWTKYSGSNPHNKHIHVSVGVGNDGQSKQPYDDTTPWKINQGQQPIGEEMITKDDIGILRILHSMAGWDFEKTHAGIYDQIFLNAWQGKPVKELIWAQWNAGSNYMRVASEAYKKLPEMEKSLNSLSSRPTKEEYAKVQAELQDAINDVSEARKKAEEEAAKRTEDTKLLDEGKGVFSWVSKLIERLKR